MGPAFQTDLLPAFYAHILVRKGLKRRPHQGFAFSESLLIIRDQDTEHSEGSPLFQGILQLLRELAFSLNLFRIHTWAVRAEEERERRLEALAPEQINEVISCLALAKYTKRKC